MEEQFRLPSPLRVSDVMVRKPYVIGRGTTLGEAYTFLSNAHVHMLLITDHGRVGEQLLGTLRRDDLRAVVPSDSAALELARLGDRVVRDDVRVVDAYQAMERIKGRRLAAVDHTGRLTGLVCLNSRGTGFCSDAGVESRRMDRPSLGEQQPTAPTAGDYGHRE